MNRSRPFFTGSLGAALLLALGAQFLDAQATATRAQSTTGFIKEFGTMWTFDAPPLDYWEATYGFRPDQGWLDHVRMASVRLPGCSSSFVSADGLVMTNHHCARESIEQVSREDEDLVADGFYAASLEEERPIQEYWADQLIEIRDVTAAVARGIGDRRLQTSVLAA